ncbi:MAG: cation-translocating P-type ATPase, partial [Myxococcota bacterium]
MNDESTTRPWHALPQDELFEQTRSSPEGLSTSEAAKRLEEHGPNVLRRVSGDGPLRILWRQINDPLIWVLIGSAAIAMAIGKVTDGAVVAAVVVLNSIIGFVQEYRASKAIEALRDMVPEFSNTLRDGHTVSIPIAQLVPGDVVMLASGDKVPADVRLIAAKNLRVEEAALTGESVPVEKRTTPVEEDASLGDRTSMAFGGTLVTYGTATAVVVATGAGTELGRISELLQETTELETPLTRALGGLGKVITIGIGVLSAIILAIGLWRALSAGMELGMALRETLVFAIALAVGAIPEGLPAIVTIALAIGVRRMAARRAIIRRLPAVETLGSTTVICTDKTGTLTRNEMTVQVTWSPGEGACNVEGVGYEPRGRYVGCEAGEGIPASHRRLVENAALCNDAALLQEEGTWKIAGDPTEGALVVAAEKAGIGVEALRRQARRLDAIPFESENQYMATLHEGGESRRILIKGAPEVVL